MGADKLAENTPNNTKFICPICLPKPNSLGFRWKKTSSGIRSPWILASPGFLQTFSNVPFSRDWTNQKFDCNTVCGLRMGEDLSENLEKLDFRKFLTLLCKCQANTQKLFRRRWRALRVRACRSSGTYGNSGDMFSFQHFYQSSDIVKMTQNLSKDIDLTLSSPKSVMIFFFQIVWPSHNIMILPYHLCL